MKNEVEIVEIGNIKLELGKDYGYGKLIEIQKKLNLPHPRKKSVKEYLEKNYGITCSEEKISSGLPDGTEYWWGYKTEYKWIFIKSRKGG